MSNYWVDRFLDEEKRRDEDARKYFKTIEREYDKALVKIDKDIESWLVRIAENNQISFQGAKELLRKKELKEFKWTVEEYIQKGKENGLNGKWIKELENASARVHIQRLEAMKIQIQHRIENLYGNVDSQIEKHLKNVYKDTYYKTAFEISKGQQQIRTSFSKLDNRLIDEVITKPWAPDGKNFSSRLWKDKENLINTLHTGLTQYTIRGGNINEVVNDLTKFVSDRVKNKKAVAKRLLLTESSAYASKAQLKSYKELGCKKYEIVATLDLKTSNICQDMDGKVFDMKDYQIGVTTPPFHPNCRTTTVPYFDDDKGERAARDENGKTVYVPSNIKYDEWYERYVEKKLTLEEEKAIMDYKSPGGAVYILNDKLRQGLELNEAEKEWVKNLDNALKKIPRYEGEVIRTIEIRNREELNKFIWDCKPKEKIFNFKAFTSTSKGEVYNEDMQIRFIIPNSTKGRDLSKFGLKEDEVLYERNCKFKVLDVYLGKDDKFYIELEEVDE